MRWAVFFLLAACVQAPPPDPPQWARFENPQPVAIEGYAGDAMEPFLARDGDVLFFNNSNDPSAQTDLHWAERVDDVTFRYRGPVAGANGPALDAVASMSADGRFCFVSPRSYEATLATVHCGDWDNDVLGALSLQRDASAQVRGRVVFDLEVSADGSTLVIADGEFRGGAMPASADLRLARWRDGAFRLSPQDDELFAAVNTDALEYAAALSTDGLTLAFTRLEGRPPFARTLIWIARREALDASFGAPARIAAIEGDLVEGPTFSPSGDAIYYHRKVGDRYAIWRVSR